MGILQVVNITLLDT